MKGFINFDIIVSKDGDNYLIKCKYEKGGELDKPVTQENQPDLSQFEGFEAYMAGEVENLAPEVAREAGKALRDWLLKGEIWTELVEKRRDAKTSHNKNIRLRLILEDPELRRLPWEYCYDSHRYNSFLALDRESPIIRYIQQADIPPERFQRGREARLMLAYSVDPADEKAVLGAQAELRRIEEELSGQVSQKRLVIHNVGKVGEANLQSEVVAFAPDMLHLVATSQGGKNPTLLLYEKEGPAGRYDADVVQNWLRGIVRVVVLSAPPNTAAHNDGGLALAEALNSARIPAVIALHRAMPPNVAGYFAAKIYHFLTINNQPLDEAITEMRINIYGRDKAAWGIPAMYMRAEDGRLWHEDSPEPAETTIARPAQPLEHPQIPDPYAPLMNLNFHHQVKGFEAFIKEWRIGGCLVSSQPQKPSEIGLKLLVKRLVEMIPHDGQPPMIKHFDLVSNTIDNGPADIWQRVAADFAGANKVTLDKTTGPLTAGDRERVAAALGDQLSRHHVIFIFEHVDDATIGPLINDFWEPLLRILLDPLLPLALPKGRFFLLAFFLDNDGAVRPQSGGKFIEILADDESGPPQPAGGWLREHVGRSFALPVVTDFNVEDLDELAAQVKPVFLSAAKYEISQKLNGRAPDVLLEILANTLEEVHPMNPITFDDWLEHSFFTGG